jgi:hypothetical protein
MPDSKTPASIVCATAVTLRIAGLYVVALIPNVE